MKIKIKLLFLILCVAPLYGQKMSHTRTSNLDCSPTPKVGCSHILNSEFDSPFPSGSNFPYQSAFRNNLVTNWQALAGSPALYNQLSANNFPDSPPPQGQDTYAILSCYAYGNNGTSITSDGIMQKIPKLKSGHTYRMSFFRKFNNGILTDAGSLEYYIYGFKCSDINYPIPCDDCNDEIMNTHVTQKLVCESVLVGENYIWQQIVFDFTAADDWDSISILSIKSEFPSCEYDYAVLISYPEIIDITHFDAGINIINPQDCKILIGPEVPNCGVKNSEFRWIRPDGTIIPVSSDNQQIVIDTSDPVNIGNWILEMTVPALFTSNVGAICNEVYSLENVISSKISVEACNPIQETWPKVYNNALPLYTRLDKIDNKNYIMSFIARYEITNSVNHIGSSYNSNPIQVSGFQYSNYGYSNWSFTNTGINFVFKNKTLQVDDRGRNLILKALDGTPAATSLLLPSEESIVIAETNDNKLLTKKRMNSGFLIELTSNTNTNTSFVECETGYNLFSRYDKQDDILYIVSKLSGGFYLNVYKIENSSFILQSTSQIYREPVLIDDNGIAYIINNNKLFKYNYHFMEYTLVSILNFNNENIKRLRNTNPYTENKCIVSGSDSLYYLNFEAGSNFSKKIDYYIGSNTYVDNQFSYAFDDDYYNVYIAGINYEEIKIGGQIIPYITPTTIFSESNTFFTKLSLLSDFNRISQNGFKAKDNQILAQPNPTFDSIHVNSEIEIDNVHIYNITGHLVAQYNPNKQKVFEIELINLPSGTYIAKFETRNGSVTKKIILK